jgi:hypothetical protein
VDHSEDGFVVKIWSARAGNRLEAFNGGGSMDGGAIDKAQWRRRLATELECPVATVVKSDLSRTDVRKAIAISGKESVRRPARC